MKAMIFAAGIGSRLRPWTLEHPKALVPVGGTPMLGRVIESLKALGIDQMVVNTHHFAPQIADYLAQERNFGIHIDISDESDLLLDTGGGLLRARSLLGSDCPILLHNADVLTSLFSLAPCPELGDADALLMVSERPSSRSLIFSPEGSLTGWRNNSTGATRGNAEGQALAFNGVHLISPRIFPALEAYAQTKGEVFSLTDFYLDSCTTLNIRCHRMPAAAKWFDVGRPESLEQARLWIASSL